MSDADAWERSGSIGRPLMFTEARVVGPDGHEVEVDVVGELVFRGPHVSSGYWNNPAATRAAIDGDGWFHTGDMARRDAGGFFYIAGRAKDMFISGGVNVYPAEIENVLKDSPFIREAIVVGDGRKFLGGLIQIDFDTVGRWASDHGLPYLTSGTFFQALASHVRTLYRLGRPAGPAPQRMAYPRLVEA